MERLYFCGIPVSKVRYEFTEDITISMLIMLKNRIAPFASLSSRGLVVLDATMLMKF